MDNLLENIRKKILLNPGKYDDVVGMIVEIDYSIYNKSILMVTSEKDIEVFKDEDIISLFNNFINTLEIFDINIDKNTNIIDLYEKIIQPITKILLQGSRGYSN